jgi:hypothetical protein
VERVGGSSKTWANAPPAGAEYPEARGEVPGTIAFPAGPIGSAVTGTVLAVDGGMQDCGCAGGPA